MTGKINWDRPVEWSTGERTFKLTLDIVQACREWLNLTGDGSVAIDMETGRILGCEEEDLPFVRNVALSGELGINTMGEVHIGDTYIEGDVNDGLTEEQAAIVARVWEAQKLNDSRIRMAYFGGRPVVESEFIAFSDDAKMWARINAAAALIDAKVDEMCEFPHLDHCTVQQEGSRPCPERAGWFIGPDHGRMERQVALQLFLTDDFTPEQHEAARQVLRDATDDLWSDAGVALL